MQFEQIDTLLSAHYQPQDYPVCHHQRQEWGKARPFAGLTVLDVTPIFRNTLVKHRALIEGGARLIVGRNVNLPADEQIVELLRNSGIEVVESGDVPREVDVVLDCAASFSHWHARLGYVELTRSGVPKYEGKDAPVFVADSGRIKKIETCLGTGESYFRTMAHIGHTQWQGKKIVIFGSGKVGTGLLTYAYHYGAVPTVVTMPKSVTEPARRMAHEIIDCRNHDAVAAALADAYAVVTATGIAGALSHPVVTRALIESPAILANMGVEDEYGEAMPASRVLNGKRVFNFILDEPTHMKYIDATMGLHNEGINYLLAHPEERHLIEPPAELESRLLEITRKHGTITQELDLI